MEVEIFAVLDTQSNTLLNTRGKPFTGSKTSPVRWFGRKSDAAQSFPLTSDRNRYKVVEYKVNI